MPASEDCRDWIDELWPLVCQRAMRPLGGILLDRTAAGGIAGEIFADFLDAFPQRPGAWETVLHWLTSRVRPMALALVAEERRRQGNWNLYRDPRKAAWERNPDFDALRRRDADGALLSREWDVVAPILWRTAQPVMLRLGIGEEDARDIHSEALAELTQAGKTAGTLEKLIVFEELPKFFTTMIERRAISWLRKAGAIKRRPVNPNYAEPLDDPDNAAGRQLTDPQASARDSASPWVHAGFDRIRTACAKALTDFEWHLVEVIFVEASQSRGDLAADPWVLEQLGISATASESKRRRFLNGVIDTALARLGRALRESDL